MFIRFTPKNAHVKTIPLVPFTKNGKSISFSNDSVIIRPGTNEISEDEWDAIQPHIKDQIGKEIVAFTVPVKARGKNKKAGTLKDVPLATARKIIEGCQNAADLKKWLKQELPDEVILIVFKRMRKLNIDPDEIVDNEQLDDSLDDDITQENGDDEPEHTDERTDNADAENGEDVEEDETSDVENLGDSESDGDDYIPNFDGNQHEE